MTKVFKKELNETAEQAAKRIVHELDFIPLCNIKKHLAFGGLVVWNSQKGLRLISDLEQIAA